MDAVGEWFRWVAGITIGVLTAAVGWGAAMVNGNRNKITDLEKRMAVLEARPHVDPIHYTEAITKMSGVLATLTDKIAENIQVRQEQYVEMRQVHSEFKEQLELFHDELDEALRKLGALAAAVQPKGPVR